MKNDKLKYGILAVLIVVAGAIWLRNLGFFSSSPQYYHANEDKAGNPDIPVRTNTQIEYKKPKTNPFFKLNSEVNQPKPAAKKKPDQQVQIPPSIGSSYRIDGIVLEFGNPQAILKQSNGKSVLLTTGDSLNGWKVMSIYEDMIIFSRDKYDDTLFLVN